MKRALTYEIGEWAAGLRFEDLPSDVVDATKLRVMDVLGLALAGLETGFGRSTRASAVQMFPPGPCHVVGAGDRLGVTAAPFVNAAAAQALEFDDTHIESIVHMSSPAVASALALSEIHQVSGKELITAIALGNEVSCRVGSVSSGEFHKRGFHPTGLFAPFGVAYLAGKLLGLDVGTMAAAAGITGSLSRGFPQPILPVKVRPVRRRFSKADSVCSRLTCPKPMRRGTSAAFVMTWERIGRAGTHHSNRFPRPTFCIHTSMYYCA